MGNFGMDLVKSTMFLVLCTCLLKVYIASAFECPPVRNQLLIADPEDCRNYYHCLPGGRVYVKMCPKGLVFDAKQKVCVWDSYLSCLKPHQKEPVNDNTIDNHPKIRHMPSIKTTRKVRRTTTTIRPTIKTTRKTTTTTHQRKMSINEAEINPIVKKDREIIYEAGGIVGDYPDMAFDNEDANSVNNTEDRNDTTSDIGDSDEEHFHSGDSKSGNQYDENSNVENSASTLDDYSSFLFFPNRRLIKRAPGPEPATYAYKIACPNAFAYVTEPDNCDTFYHCNNWKPFVKRCPPGLYFDATNLVCNWPHNVNCYEGKRANTYYKFNQMRSEKFRKKLENPKVVLKETPMKDVPVEEYKINPTTHRQPKTTKSIKVTTSPPSPLTTKANLTTTEQVSESETKTLTNQKTTTHAVEMKTGSIFAATKGDFKTLAQSNKTSTLKTTTSAPTIKMSTTESRSSYKTTRVNKYMRNMKQRNLYLFGKSPFSQPSKADIQSSVEPNIRPTLLSKTNHRNNIRVTSKFDDSPRMNPFTRPSYNTYETLRSKNIQRKNSRYEAKAVSRPSIILVDNSHLDEKTFRTTKSRAVKDIYGRIKIVPAHTSKMVAFTPKSTPATTTVKSSSIDYTATTSSGPNATNTDFEASTSIATSSTELLTETETHKVSSTNRFETLPTQPSPSIVRAVQYADKPGVRTDLKLQKAFSDLEPSKYAAQNMTRKTNNPTSMVSTTTISINTTGSTAKSFTATDNPSTTFKTQYTSDKDPSTTDKASSTTDKAYSTDVSKVSQNNKTNIFTTTMASVVESSNGTVNETDSILNVTNFTTVTVDGNATLVKGMDMDNKTVDFYNDTSPVNVSSFRANLDALIDTYHAYFENVDFKSTDEDIKDVKDEKDVKADKDVAASFNAGTNDTIELSTRSIPVSFTARTNTDRSAMMVQKQQVEIEKFMSKMISSAFNPKQSKQTSHDLTANDNMIDSDMNDTPAETDRNYKKKAEKWVLFGNVDTKETKNKNKTNKADNTYENNETVEDTKTDGTTVVEEDLIAANNQEGFVQDNNIHGYDNSESSGDIDNYRNAIMIDNTDETKLLEYLSSEENNEENHRNGNFYDAPVPSKKESTNKSDTPKTTNADQAASSDAQTTMQPTTKDNEYSDSNATTVPTGSSSTEYVDLKTTNKPGSTTETLEIVKNTTTENTVTQKIFNVSENNTESENTTNLVQNDEASVIKINDEASTIKINEASTIKINEPTTQEVAATDAPETTSKEMTNEASSTAVVISTDDATNKTSGKTTANVTDSELVNNETDDATSKATMRLTKSTAVKGVSSTISIASIDSTIKNSKHTESKKSFISLSDLIKWYLRHWKNYSQWKGAKVQEDEPTKES